MKIGTIFGKVNTVIRRRFYYLIQIIDMVFCNFTRFPGIELLWNIYVASSISTADDSVF